MAELADLKAWRFHIDFEDIAWAVIDLPGESMNTLGETAVRELERIVGAAEEAARTGAARGIVFMSGKETSFIAGADIREFGKLTREADIEAACRQVTEIFNRVERLSMPAVAAIHGYCLGGGLEFAMACHYRIADREDKTQLGLPEVKLGLIPGLHGSARMLKLAGPLDAMPAMLTGRMLRSRAAKAMGIVDELVPTHHELRWAARKAVLELRRSKGRPVGWKRLLTLDLARPYLAKRMRAETAAKVREDHYPAPFRLIDLFERFGGDTARMAAAETRFFSPLMAGGTSRNLRRVFLLSEMLKAQAPKGMAKPQRVHVIGAGTMGGGIAAVCCAAGMEVSLQDTSKEAVAKAITRAEEHFRRRLRKPLAVSTAKARLYADVEGVHLPRADVVIEAIYENLEAKQALFRSIEPRLKPGAILATNTSSIRIEALAEVLADPGRLIGLHFFNPVERMPLVEVIRGEQSRDEEIAKGCAFVKAIEKFPLIVKSSPGFLVNRVLGPYLAAAMRMREEGTAREKIDAAALEFGMPMGPLELMDVVGLDVVYSVENVLGGGVPDDTELARLYKAGKLGKKTGEGFYTWVAGKARKMPVEFDKAELLRLGEDLVKPLIDECEKALAEGVVANADLVDAGVIFGIGFAPFRGGPLNYRASLMKGKPVDGAGLAATA